MTTETITRGPAVSLADVEAISARQNEPAWLREQRLEAWRLYETMDLPDPGDEQWRRTDVRAIPLDGVRIDGAPRSADRPRPLPADLAAQGVIVCDLHVATREHGDLVRKYLGTAVKHDEWKYVALNAAAWSGGTLLYVPKDTVVAEPIQILASLSKDDSAVLPRTLIVIGPYASVKIVDEASSSDDGAPSFVSGAVEIFVGEGAKVEYYSVNGWGRNVYNFNTVRAVLGRDAEFTATVVGIGSKLTKTRYDVLMPESGARTLLLGVTFGDGDQHFDYNTLQDHSGKHTTSDLQFKSALTDSASLVWYGVTHIRRSAGGSEANQTSRNLLLSEHAKAAPIPILEIEAYDVSKCSHGATVGPVDENELFYLQSRAIPHDVAERMLVEGYFADVLDRVPDARLRRRMMDAVLAKMGGGVGTLTFDDVLSA
jgi:Fe-S cluster assembly protein SufD